MAGSWSPDVQINYLRRTLNGDIRRSCLASPDILARGLPGFVRMLQALGTNLDEFQALPGL